MATKSPLPGDGLNPHSFLAREHLPATANVANSLPHKDFGQGARARRQRFGQQRGLTRTSLADAFGGEGLNRDSDLAAVPERVPRPDLRKLDPVHASARRFRPRGLPAGGDPRAGC